jgi:hypothetical protein
MNNELERTWKETVVARFKILTHHLPGGTKETHRKPQLSSSAAGD